MTSGEAPQSPYQGPEWVFTAPPGSTIAGGTINATLTSPHGQAWLGTPNASYDSGDILANCQYNLACGQNGTLTGAFPITHTGGSSLYAIAVCVGTYEGATSCPVTGGVDAAVTIGAATIELENDATPTAEDFAGPLLSPEAQGTQDLSFQASDPTGPGVYLVTLQIDGKTVYSGTPDTNGGKCVPTATNEGDLTFTHGQPCKASESVDIPVNTATLPDGSHNLKVTLEDAAQNSSVVLNRDITTKQPSNGSLGVEPEPGSGGSGGTGSGSTGGGTSTSGSTSSATAGGPSSPGTIGPNEGCRIEIGQDSSLSRSFAKREIRVTGRLVNAFGAPLANETMELLQQVTGSNKWSSVGHISTGNLGTFATSVPGKSSRTIEVAYRASSSEDYCATAKIKEQVSAGVQLHITPRRTSPNGTITLSGRVQGAIPRHGVIVELQVHYRGRWAPFRTPRTDRHGHFSRGYQFQSGVGRFPFRAVIPAGQAGFPFGRGQSPVVYVTTH